MLKYLLYYCCSFHFRAPLQQELAVKPQKLRDFEADVFAVERPYSASHPTTEGYFPPYKQMSHCSCMLGGQDKLFAPIV